MIERVTISGKWSSCVIDGSDAKLQGHAKRGGLQTIPSSKGLRQAEAASKSPR